MFVVLVDAAQHAGPALFQGIGMIVVAVWGIWYVNRPIFPHEKHPWLRPPKKIFDRVKVKNKKPFWSYANGPGNQPNE